MMLNAKIQVTTNLKRDFKRIMDANMDSFNQQMVSEMKKCVTNAFKEHFVNLVNERLIIENLKYSEEWFIQAYTKLKQVCGHRLVDVDFKEFNDILQCIIESDNK